MSNDRADEYENENLVVGSLSDSHRAAINSLSDAEHQELKRIVKKCKDAMPEGDDGEMQSAGWV